VQKFIEFWPGISVDTEIFYLRLAFLSCTLSKNMCKNINVFLMVCRMNDFAMPLVTDKKFLYIPVYSAYC
jgi:hypothetical protein